MGLLDSLPRPTKTYHSGPYDRISPSATKFDGKGKTVLITGGSQGVGLSIAKAFAEAGVSKIVIVSVSAEKQAEAKKTLAAEFPDTEVQTISLSVTDLPRVSEVMHSVGDIDILVLNAAVTHKHVPSAAVPMADFEKTFNTNVNAPFHMVKQYLELPMPKSGGKTIINISSVGAHFSIPGQVGYGPSKAAFLAITHALSAEYTPEKDGVRIFSFHPGAFFTNSATASWRTR